MARPVHAPCLPSPVWDAPAVLPALPPAPPPPLCWALGSSLQPGDGDAVSESLLSRKPSLAQADPASPGHPPFGAKPTSPRSAQVPSANSLPPAPADLLQQVCQASPARWCRRGRQTCCCEPFHVPFTYKLPGAEGDWIALQANQDALEREGARLLIPRGQWHELVLLWAKQFAVTRLTTLPQGGLWDSPLSVQPGEGWPGSHSLLRTRPPVLQAEWIDAFY